MNPVVLDTDVASLIFKGELPDSVAAQLIGYRPCITFVTLAELAKWVELRSWGSATDSQVITVDAVEDLFGPVGRHRCVVQWAARRWVGKVAVMSTAAGADHVPARPLPPGSSPQAIRAALLPEEVGNFDREYRREMATAIETLDLTPVIEMLARWQLVARSSQDPQAHRRMLAHAAILNAGGDIPRTPWEETKARLGL